MVPGARGGSYGDAAVAGYGVCVRWDGARCESITRVADPEWYVGVGFYGLADTWCWCDDPTRLERSYPIADEGSLCAVGAQCDRDRPSRATRTWHEWAPSLVASESCSYDADTCSLSPDSPRAVSTFAVCREMALVDDVVVVSRPFVPPRRSECAASDEPDQTSYECPAVSPYCAPVPSQVVYHPACPSGRTGFRVTRCMAGAVPVQTDACTQTARIATCDDQALSGAVASVAAIPAAAPTRYVRESGRRSDCVSTARRSCGWGTASVEYVECVPADPGCRPDVGPPGWRTRACYLGECGRKRAVLPCGNGVMQDVRGSCCAEGETLDACGLCPAVAYADVHPNRFGLDARGQCCSGDSNESRLLTGALDCCEPNAVDMCGVCGGDNASCTMLLSVQSERVDLSAFAASVSHAAGVRAVADTSGRRRGVRVSPGTPVRTLDLASAVVEASEATGADAGLVQLTAVRVVNNGVCELGEVADESTDCFPARSACPPSSVGAFGAFIGDPARECGGVGVCYRAATECICPPGHAGYACDRCAHDYAPVQLPSGRFACGRVTDVRGAVLEWIAASILPVLLSSFAFLARRRARRRRRDSRATSRLGSPAPSPPFPPPRGHSGRFSR